MRRRWTRVGNGRWRNEWEIVRIRRRRRMKNSPVEDVVGVVTLVADDAAQRPQSGIT
jgi:hypothetical protein